MTGSGYHLLLGDCAAEGLRHQPTSRRRPSPVRWPPTRIGVQDARAALVFYCFRPVEALAPSAARDSVPGVSPQQFPGDLSGQKKKKILLCWRKGESTLVRRSLTAKPRQCHACTSPLHSNRGQICLARRKTGRGNAARVASGNSPRASQDVIRREAAGTRGEKMQRLCSPDTEGTMAAIRR